LSEDENPQNFDPEEFAKFLQELINGGGNINAEELAKISGLPNDPATINALLASLKQAITQGDSQTVEGVNWTLASQQAINAAREGSNSNLDSIRSGLTEAINIAGLWLDQATDLSALASEPKVVSREVWVQDALPLFQELAGPIAKRVAVALAENMSQNLPEELAGLSKGAEGIMRSAGGALFAMQLGHTLGKLSHEVLTGGDIGLPFYSEARAAFVPGNLKEFVTENELAQDQALIYLAVRELAYARLFKHSRWLRESVITQLTNYASEIRIDAEAMTELASEITPENAEALKSALESGALLAERTEDQQAALAGIEHLLALVEGWVDSVTDRATTLLPSKLGIQEVMRRRRATSSPAQSTFATLVGLELRPKRSREVAAFWSELSGRLGVAGSDELWNHPDLLPTPADIDDLDAFLARRVSGDDLDQALKDLLGE
jgi:putative hydrolase